MDQDVIEEVHEKLVYIIECLAENLTGEARREIVMLENLIQSLEDDQLPSSANIVLALKQALDSLNPLGVDRAARAALPLTEARRFLRNKVQEIRGEERLYNVRL